MNQTSPLPPTPNQPSGHYISRNQLYAIIAIGVTLVLAFVLAAGAAFSSTSTASGSEALPPVVVPPSTEPSADPAPSSTEPPPTESTEPPPTQSTEPPPPPPPSTSVAPPPPSTSVAPPPPPPPPPPPVTTLPLPTTTLPPAPELSQIVVEVTRVVGEASLHLDGQRIAGTGADLKFGAESIDRINLTELLDDRNGTLMLDFWKLPCWGAEFRIDFYIDGVKDSSSDSMRDCVSDLNWSWDVDPIAGTVTRS